MSSQPVLVTQSYSFFQGMSCRDWFATGTTAECNESLGRRAEKISQLISWSETINSSFDLWSLVGNIDQIFRCCVLSHCQYITMYCITFRNSVEKLLMTKLTRQECLRFFGGVYPGNQKSRQIKILQRTDATILLIQPNTVLTNQITKQDNRQINQRWK